MRHKNSVLLAATLAALALAVPALAQGFGGPPPGGGFGGPPPGGGGFGGQRRPPFTFGTVSSVDTNAGTITVASGNGDSQTIKVGADAQVITQATVKVSDLKVGDQVSVQGVPTGITASQLTVGQAPAGLPVGGFGGPRRPGGNPTGGGNAQAFAQATGKIKALPTGSDPHLTISLNADTDIFLKMAAGAKITKYTTVALSGIKTGDRILATGQTNDDGTLTASAVGVNLPQGGFGGGGFGGFGGGGGRPGGGPRGGFGGPGGGGPDGGGPGGPPPPGMDGPPAPAPGED